MAMTVASFSLDCDGWPAGGRGATRTAGNFAAALLLMCLLPAVVFAQSGQGIVDAADNARCQVTGWARPQDSLQNATVRIFLDGTSDKGILLGSVTANQARTDLQPPNQNLGYSYKITNGGAYDDRDHSIYVYAVQTSGNILLGNYVSHCGKNDAAFVSQAVPATMIVGSTYKVAVTFRNTGTRTWRAGSHRLGPQVPQDTNRWGTTRVEVPQDIPPGGTAQFQFTVTPALLGVASFQWRMLEEFVQWFGDFAPLVSVNVGPGKASVSVTDYGAKGDGVTDDADAIQSAIDDTASGGTVFFPAGTYMLGTAHGIGNIFPAPINGVTGEQYALELKRDVTLRGTGRDSVLKLMPVRLGVAYIRGTGNFLIEKLVFDGNGRQRYRKNPATGFSFDFPNGLIVSGLITGNSEGAAGTKVINDCEFRNALEDGTGMIASPGFTVQNSYIHDNGGFAFDGGTYGGGVGISLNAGQNQAASSNIVIGNTVGLASGYGPRGVQIQHNVILGNCEPAMVIGTDPGGNDTVAPGGGFTITDNYVEANGVCAPSNAVAVEGKSDGVLTDNYLVNNSAWAAVAFFPQTGTTNLSNNWTATGNTIANTGTARPQAAGLYVKTGQTGFTIRNNKFTNNGTSLSSQIVVEMPAGANSDVQTANVLSYTPPPAIAPAAPVISAAGIVNAATGAAGAVSPGEIVSIYGSGLGPSQLAIASPNSYGRLGRIFAGTRIFFDGVPAPVWFTSSGQVAAIVPYYLYWKDNTLVQVEYNGVRSNAVTMAVQAATPGIFTVDSSGRGQGAIVNQDYSLNSVLKPAAAGSIVILYATGSGQSDPAGDDGLLAAAVFPKARLPVSVMIGGIVAEVLYAGAAPSFVAGAMQLNVRVPTGITPAAAVPVQFTVGNTTSPPGVTLAVK